jgi:Copper transport outer membrane protein, MctB
MISLRQHIFSLVAVFVALAVGIAAGSTVVRGPLLDSTRARLDAAEQNIAIERAENDVLAAELAQLDDWAIDGPTQLISGRLPDRAVMLVVAGDVDQDVTAGVLRSLRASGATFVGEVRIDPVVFDPNEATRVAEALGDSAVGVADPAVVFGEEVARLIATVAAGITGTGPVRPSVTLSAAFGDLEDSGLIDLLDVATDEVEITDMDVVVLTDRNLVADPASVLAGIVEVSDPEGAALTVLVAEVGRIAQGNESPIESFVGAIRDSGRLRDEVITVDNAETILGWVTVVLGLDAAQPGAAQHYGFRDGADRSIPPRPA